MSHALPLAFGWDSPVFFNQSFFIFDVIVYWVDAFSLNLRQRASNKYFVANEFWSSSIVTCSYIIVSHFWLAVVGPIISVPPSRFYLISSVTVSCWIPFFKSMLGFSLGKVVINPPTFRWVPQKYLSFFLWKMNWYLHIFVSLSKKAPATDYCFSKHT